MPRDIPVGNGRLLICFDRDYCLRELFFPHVGQENHMHGKVCRVGVWAEEKFSWVGPEWRKELRYLPDTMVTEVRLHNPDMDFSLLCRDAVDFHEDVYLKEITSWLLSHGVRILLIIVLALIALKAAKILSRRLFSAVQRRKDDIEFQKRTETLGSVIRYFLDVVIIIVATIMILGEVEIAIGLAYVVKKYHPDHRRMEASL